MEVTRIRALRGPNLWSRHTCIEAIVSCSPEETAMERLPGFEDRLRALFPTIGELHPVVLGQPLAVAHVLENAAVALQAQAGCPVNFGHTARTIDEGIYQVTFQYSEEAVGRRALELARALIDAAQGGTEFDATAAITELRDLDESERLGPSTGSIVDAAVARGIPYRRLTSGSLVQFGWGSKQRRIQAAEVDSTSGVAEAIAQDKELTKQLLNAAGVPVPLGRPVSDAADGWAAAQEIGLSLIHI